MATDYPKPDSLLVGPRSVGQPFDIIMVKTLTLTPASVATITTTDQTFTLTGINAAGSGQQFADLVVLVSYPAPTNACNPTGAVRVTAANTIAVMYSNPTAGALTPPSGTYVFLVLRTSINPAK